MVAHLVGGTRKWEAVTTLTVTAESTMMDACAQLQTVSRWKILPTAAAPLRTFILSPHSIVRDTPTIENVYLHAHVLDPSRHERLAARCIPTPPATRNGIQVLLQWNVVIKGIPR
jgi:hypothetical protein